jgi:hypothetical protein
MTASGHMRKTFSAALFFAGARADELPAGRRGRH